MPNLEVRQHDICTDALPEAAFDIIHARLLLEHLPPRLAVLEKLADALAPGGWLLIEDLDFTGWLNLPEEKLPVSPQTIRAAYQAAFLASASTGSWDGEWARDLPIHFMNLGLSRVGAEVCAPIIFGGSPQAAFVTVSIRQLVPLLVEGGYVSQADLDALIDAFERPGAMVGGYSMVSAWGTP